MEITRKTRRLRTYEVHLEEAHDLSPMIASSNTQATEEITEQPFNRIAAPTPLNMERISQSRHAQPSAPQHRSIYPIVEENWEVDQPHGCTGKHTTCTYVVGYGMNDEISASSDMSSHQQIMANTSRILFPFSSGSGRSNQSSPRRLQKANTISPQVPRQHFDGHLNEESITDILSEMESEFEESSEEDIVPGIRKINDDNVMKEKE
ncbi:hypothetical protein OUZ56_011951 [Daphnia magna]|uniref:Uncharacterized protein n=1 Tax=Daphnia magna TaxID=35525 RepID=A0ABQ9Z1M3_9CRUS|nr:hypothetical protein OUZ56_011951 [Daphnia magna]